VNFEFWFRVTCEDLVGLILSWNPLVGYSFTHFIFGGSMCEKRKEKKKKKTVGMERC
jgi:hypothetical protein